jgi:hypothetical protein
MGKDEKVPEKIEARPKLERQLGFMFWDDVHPQPPDPPPPRLVDGFGALCKQMKLLSDFQDAYLTEYAQPCPYNTLDDVIEALNNDCFNVHIVMLTLQWCNVERVLSEEMAKNLSDIRAALNPPAFQARL